MHAAHDVGPLLEMTEADPRKRHVHRETDAVPCTAKQTGLGRAGEERLPLEEILMRERMQCLVVKALAVVEATGRHFGRETMHLEHDQPVLVDPLRPTAEMFDRALNHVAAWDELPF